MEDVNYCNFTIVGTGGPTHWETVIQTVSILNKSNYSNFLFSDKYLKIRQIQNKIKLKE